MGLDETYHYVDTLGLKPVSFEEHLVSLAHARRVSQVHLQPAPA
jgi:hypothetical protein